MSTYKICENNRKDARLVGERAIWRNNREIVGQFNWCADGGDTGRTLCVSLLDEEKDSYAGFLGLTLTIEDLQSVIYAFVSIEFVYLHKQFRGLGLSSYFIECAIGKVNHWLHLNSNVWNGRVVTLYSASNLKSDAGSRFVGRLEEHLRAEARLRQWSFSSSIDDEC
jgi:GNAT superfamily N-acetyltransferase